MRAQSYPHWEWILAVSDGAMHDQPEAVTRLTRESRVRLIALAPEESRATAWNAAFRAARGTFAALLDPGDDLSPNALYEIASAMQRAPGCDLFYTDEDCRQRETNNRADPRFKPDWSPELLLSCNYIGRLAFLRVETALARGGFRVGYEGAEEWDLFLRLSRTNARIRRVPVCVYHRGPRADAPGRKEAEAAALLDHCADRGLEAAAVSRASAGYRITWHIKERPMVSIVIPNRNAADVIVPCVRGLLHETSYPRREVVIVDNGSTDVEVFKLYDSLRRDGRGIVIPFEEPFN